MAWISRNGALTEVEMQNNADIITAYLRNLGVNDATIGAILGNMESESTINPERQEAGGQGYGLVQWTPVSVLQSHCTTLGLSPYTSGDVQLEVCYKEIKGTPSSINEWYTTQGFISNYYNSGATSDMVGITGQDFLYNVMGWTPEKLAIMFMAGYERPAYNPSINHYTQRQTNARKWYNYITNTPTATYIARIAPFINTVFYVTSVFGEAPRNHKGIDISTGSNDMLFSVCNGVVVRSDTSDSYGNIIIIKETSTGMGYLYAHMMLPSTLSVGDTVTVGQFVGFEGTTGQSTGIHLHFEMQDLSNGSWNYNLPLSEYSNPADFMGIPNVQGIDAIYYGHTPPPPTPEKKEKGFPWPVYFRKFRERRNS